MTAFMTVLMKGFGSLLINLGGVGGKQMCSGLFHEVEIPEELKNQNIV